MVYKIISEWKGENAWEITVFKYNINHQNFVSYVRDCGEVSKRVYNTVLNENLTEYRPIKKSFLE